MIPVVQTKVVVRNTEGKVVVRGNCYAACIASILEVPITEVPNVEVLFPEEGDTQHSFWQEVMMFFLHSKGYEYCTDNRFICFHPKVYGSITYERFKEELKDKYYLVTGKSNRGVNHICIYRNGQLVHDPHPTGEGLVTEEYFESLEPVQL